MACLSRPLSLAAAHGRVARHFATGTQRADFTHVVIGGGVVGLAVARALAEKAATSPSSSAANSVLLLERHAAVGTETSARNSEVIHAGLYYPPASLKTRLCIRGRQLLYDFCARHAVDHRRTGKWIVAQTPGQRAALERLYAAAQDYNAQAAGTDVPLPLRWVPPDEARRREPAVRAEAGILESTATGIVDSHGLMQALLGQLEAAGGELALSSPVVGVKPLGRGGCNGWAVEVGEADSESGPTGTFTVAKDNAAAFTVAKDNAAAFTVVAENIVNAAGLGAADVHNMMVRAAAASSHTPASPPLRLYYAKGNYFSYDARHPRVSTLVYPAPDPSSAGGLGTHLTLDLAGRMRFGPDVEWVDNPHDLAVRAADRLPDAVRAIRSYLPDVDAAALHPDYAGIRPKLVSRADTAAGRGFADFVVRCPPGYRGWVDLLGIESPGLTSSLAIAEMVTALLYEGGEGVEREEVKGEAGVRREGR